jgi:hypothetical protein
MGINMSSFMKIGSGIQEFLGLGVTQTNTVIA